MGDEGERERQIKIKEEEEFRDVGRKIATKIRKLLKNKC